MTATVVEAELVILSGVTTRRFDPLPPALFAAVDEARRQGGLTWADVAEQTGVASATIRRTRDQGRFEVDGIIALTSWLGRSVPVVVGSRSSV